MTNSTLQSRKWQLIGMSQWCRSALCGHPLPIILCGHPLPVIIDNWTHGAASRNTIAPSSHTRASPRSRSYYSFPVPLRAGGWVSLSTQWVSNLLQVACSGPGVIRTHNLSVTSLILYHYTTAPNCVVRLVMVTCSQAVEQKSAVSFTASLHSTMGHFIYWISLSLRPKTETERLSFGLSPMLSLTNHSPASSRMSSAIHRWFRRISLFIFELVTNWSDSRSSKLNL